MSVKIQIDEWNLLIHSLKLHQNHMAVKRSDTKFIISDSFCIAISEIRDKHNEEIHCVRHAECHRGK